MKFRSLIVALACLTVAGCGDVVQVDPAHYGKILTKDGFQPDVIPPSKFRLPWCFFYCDKLITVQASDMGLKEKFRLFMPKDQLNMAFDIRMIVAVKSDKKTLNALFDRLPANKHGRINVDRIYQTYGEPIIREIARTVMAEYKINEIASSRVSVNAKLVDALKTAMKPTPLILKTVALADMQFPSVIVRAKEAAADRRVKIEQAEAQKQVRLVELQAELEQERMRRNIRKERAEATLEENEIIAKSVTESYLAYRRLEVLEEMAKNQNAVFVPFKALETLGLQNRIFQKAKPQVMPDAVPLKGDGS